MAAKAFAAPKKKKSPRAWTPFVAPTAPPAGTFDPALDQQLRAGLRGLTDFQQDTERDTGRSEDDYLTGRGNIERTRSQGLEDILRSRSRGTEDLDRRYGRLGQTQLQAGNAAGVLRGGFLAQSMRKRAANRAYDESRFNEDLDRSSTRLTEAGDRDLGQLALSSQRGGEDRSTALTRGERELGFLGQDVNEAKLAQAKGLGWEPPEKSKLEGVAGGIHYMRPEQKGGKFTLTSGRLVSRSQLLEKIRRGRAKAAA